MYLLLLLLIQNPFCESSGFNLQPGSDAIGYGVLTELHCPVPGPDTTGSGCIEWYRDPPDVGACPFITGLVLVGEVTVDVIP
jgi:hypothetical protein